MKSLFDRGLLRLAVLSLVMGCSADPTLAPYVDSTTGTIRGRLLIANDSCAKRPLVGASVSIVGTEHRTTTDEAGYWTLSNVPRMYPEIHLSHDSIAPTKWTFESGFIGADTMDLGTVTFPAPIITTARLSFEVLRRFEYVSRDSNWIEPSGQQRRIHWVDSVEKVLYVIKVNGLTAKGDSLRYGSFGVYFGKHANVNPSDPSTYLYQNVQGDDVRVGYTRINLNTINRPDEYYAEIWRPGDTVHVVAAPSPRCSSGADTVRALYLTPLPRLSFVLLQ